jgi:arylsulfatase A-like enzyme
VVFTADNGLALGSHGLLGKQSVLEHSTHVPLIVTGGGVPAGASSHALTYLHDLFPTLADVAGIPVPDGLDGESLRPVWRADIPDIRRSLFLAFMHHQRAVRDDRWKLIAYPGPGHLQLFDLQADPHETTNLEDEPNRAGDVARLQDLMRTWQHRVGDTVTIPTTNREPTRIDLTGQPRTPDQWQPEWIVEKYFPSERAR